jgi:hypothetical protein
VVELLAVCGSYALATATEADGAGAGHSQDVVVMRPRPGLVAGERVTSGAFYWAVVVDRFSVMDVRVRAPVDAKVNVLQLIDADTAPSTGLDEDEDALVEFAQAAGPSNALEDAFVRDWVPGYARVRGDMAPAPGWATDVVGRVPGVDDRGLLDVDGIRQWDAANGIVLAVVGDTPGGPPFNARLRTQVATPGRCGPWTLERITTETDGTSCFQFVPDVSGEPV